MMMIFIVALLAVGPFYFYRVHAGRIVLPKLPIEAHLFHSAL